MTSDGISTEDWRRVADLACNIVNATGEAERAATESLRRLLQELRARYGERPSILSTEAWYAETPRESELLLLKGFELATVLQDATNLKEISFSLAGLYIRHLADTREARRWLASSLKWVDPEDDLDWWEYDAIDLAIWRVEHDKA